MQDEYKIQATSLPRMLHYSNTLAGRPATYFLRPGLGTSPGLNKSYKPVISVFCYFRVLLFQYATIIVFCYYYT